MIINLTLLTATEIHHYATNTSISTLDVQLISTLSHTVSRLYLIRCCQLIYAVNSPWVTNTTGLCRTTRSFNGLSLSLKQMEQYARNF